MKCWYCKTELVWSGDADFEDIGLEDKGIISYLQCYNCPTSIEVYYNIDKEKDYK